MQPGFDGTTVSVPAHWLKSELWDALIPVQCSDGARAAKTHIAALGAERRCARRSPRWLQCHREICQARAGLKGVTPELGSSATSSRGTGRCEQGQGRSQSRPCITQHSGRGWHVSAGAGLGALGSQFGLGQKGKKSERNKNCNPCLPLNKRN